MEEENIALLKNLVQVFALFSTIGFFLAGSVACLRIHRTKSVEQTNFLPYVTTFLNCMLWAFYGVLKGDWLLIVVNSTGVTLQVVYMFVYIQNAHEKNRYTKQAMGCLCFIMVVVLISQFSGSQLDSMLLLGWLSCSVTVIMFASPLSTMKEVVKTRNAGTISFPVSLMTVVVCCSWLMYGYLIHDYFVQVPNFLGGLLGIVQLYLIKAFTSPTSSTRTKVTI